MTSDPGKIDRTLVQNEDERFRAQERSLRPVRPPLEVPGYRAERFLGAGAYGQVWVAVDVNTGRRVAIKFYMHRGGLDWPLLSREVERLALLFADRYVVQLFDVGWDADPPYFVMEYLDNGSLADRLLGGSLPVNEAVDLFHEVAVGLVHTHGKGVLHCDLKPANVLLDQDGRPRLADFGQARLSSEQSPSLGTMFYMAPEQADMQATPDARWDVYALGALLFCMLTGAPPYRAAAAARQFEDAADLEEKLARYRQFIERAPAPREHRRRTGVDRELADIVSRCLEVNPHKRYPNPQAVLSALRARDSRRARRPLLVLGAVGPAVLLTVMALFGWDAFETSVTDSREALVQRALESDRFAAQFVAATVARAIDRRWQILEHAADDPELRELLLQAAGENRESPARQALQSCLADAHRQNPIVDDDSWFVVDARGRQLARSPWRSRTIDQSFAHRDYFHGRGYDMAPGAADDVEPIRTPHLSIVFVSEATGERSVVLSTPIWDSDDPKSRKVIGVLGHSMGLGHFAELRADERSGNEQLAVLVDTKPDDTGRRGAILEHSDLRQLLKKPDLDDSRLYVDPQTVKDIERLRQLKSEPNNAAAHPSETKTLAWIPDYRDPANPQDGRWLAGIEPVEVATRPMPSRDTGWAVIVQELYVDAVRPVKQLRERLIVQGELAAVAVFLVISSLWAFVLLVLNHSPLWREVEHWWRRHGQPIEPGESSSLTQELPTDASGGSASSMSEQG